MEAETVQRSALELARQLRLETIVRIAVASLAGSDDTALARLWLVGSGDICPSCPMRRECPDQERCLHLVASAGNPSASGVDWSGTQGTFRRLPLGIGKVGRTGRSGTAVLLHDMSERSNWIAHPGWATEEGIRGFAAQPLVASDEVIGVLAVFRRSRIDPPAFHWLRVLADHVAAAVARARAIEQIERRSAAAERASTALRAELRRREIRDTPGIPDVPVLSIGEWRQHERANLEAALRRSGGRVYGKDGAAALLGVPPTTLASRLKVLGVSVSGRRLAGPS